MRPNIESKVKHYYIKKIYFRSVETEMPIESYVLQDSPLSACLTYMLNSIFLSAEGYNYQVDKNEVKFFLGRTPDSPLTMTFYID